MEFYFFFSLFFCVSCVVTIGSERVRFSFLFRPGSERMRVGKFGARLHFDGMGVVGGGRWRCAIRRQYHTHSVLCPCILLPSCFPIAISARLRRSMVVVAGRFPAEGGAI